MFDSTAHLRLISMSGPASVSMPLDPARAGGVTIGRRTTSDLMLDSLEVSRAHASLAYEAGVAGATGRWLLTDSGSRQGTRLNGVMLAPHKPSPIQPGDLIQIGPWTLRIVEENHAEAEVDGVKIGKSAGPRRGSRPSTLFDDHNVAGAKVTSINVEAHNELARERLRLLLSCAESIHRCSDQASLAEAVLDAAVAGTGMANAAVICPVQADGAVEIIAQRGDISGSSERPQFSRSLLAEACKGAPVQLLCRAATPAHAMSIVDLDIQEAICIPLLIESSVASILYLDNRKALRADRAIAHDAAAFALGLGRLASLALANLARRDLERRYAMMRGELAAAANVQRLILPPRRGETGGIEYVGECRPGRVVGGDFFDIVPLGDGRVAVALGDVSGKGMPASVLMSTTQAFLHAALLHHGDAGRAATQVNEFVVERRESGTFVTLWIGIFDPHKHALQYVDAGHGYAWQIGRSSGSMQMMPLCTAGGPPVGVDAGTVYAPALVRLEAGGRVVLVSDGIIEQPAASDDGRHGVKFGPEGLQSWLQSPAGLQTDEVAALFDHVQRHAGSADLADDATVLVVCW